MSQRPDHQEGTGGIPVALAIGAAMLIAAGIYYLLDLGPGRTPGSGAMTLTFLLVVPAVLSAFMSFVTDIQGRRGLGHYLLMPFYLFGAALLAGVILFGEGVICILLLMPLWMAGGAAGSGLTYLIRRRLRERGRLFSSALLLIPLLAVQIEAAAPPRVEWYEVRREILIDAPPERVWPLLVAIPAIRSDEGRWNATQDLLGVPRPSEAALVRQDGELVRLARWGDQVRFEERISGVQPGRSLEWQFAFPDASVQEHTDRHISPDGMHLRIATGAYTLAPAPGGQTRLRLETRYAVRTPLNAYAAWWGEHLLGDIQDNVLGIVKDRAERS